MFQSGNGTQANPFMIMTEGQLKNFAASVNGGATYEGQYIQLGNDIPLTENWSPMGTFSGTFDGQNHSVTGLNIINGTGYTGFFSHLSGATVRKLKIENATITCGADCWVGVIAGRADNSTIENCTVSGTITANNVGTSQSGNHGVAAAGVVEYAYQSTISNTTSAVNITVSTTDEIAYVGGIACEANGTRHHRLYQYRISKRFQLYRLLLCGWYRRLHEEQQFHYSLRQQPHRGKRRIQCGLCHRRRHCRRNLV